MNEGKLPERSPSAPEAADWYARLRAPNVTEFDAARFRAWVTANPEHRREFEALDQFWDDLGAIEDSPEVLQVREAAARRRMMARRGATAPTTHAVAKYWRFWAATMATMLILGAIFWLQRQPVDRYATDVGEQRSVSLPDGSVVTLDTASEVRVHFSPERRGVELVSGQAGFDVAKDSKRPFVVTAGDEEVRAVGTQFDVYKTADKVTVTLIEGKLAIREPHTYADIRPAEMNLAAGEQLSYEIKTGVGRRTRVDILQASAWRARKLDFSDTLLIDAIAQANRYSRVQIELDAPELRAARISGKFEAGRSDVFVEGLQAYFNLRVERPETGRIVLTSRR